ncbi:MAG: hypothetical protein ACTSXK_00990 [Promethearchaeota archaeon]
MTTNILSENELLFKPTEELAPYNNWLSMLKSFAINCVKKNHFPINVGKSYTAFDFWMVLIIHALLNLSLDEASDRLNQLLWNKENSHRRNKIFPIKYHGKLNVAK